MDPGQVVTIAIVAVAIWYGPRLVLGSVGAAGDVVAQLFVPPDRSLGWPQGVQESDAPWGWRLPAPSSPLDLTPSPAEPSPFVADVDLLDSPVRSGSFVVPVQRVRPD